MNYWELIAALLGIVSVWYARKENILVFPFGIANVTLYIFLCVAARLYANAGINFIYLVTNIYGWYMWSRTDADNEQLQISRNSRKQNIIAWTCAGIAYVVVFFVLRYANRADPEYLNSYLSYIDSFNTSFFLIATVLMAIKKVENWLFWIIGNIISIPIYASQGMYFTSIQYSVFLVLAILGWREWRKKVSLRDKIAV